MKKRFLHNKQTPYQADKQKGQGLVEYALLLILVGIAVIAIVRVMEPAIGDVFQRMIDRNVVAPPELAGYTPPPTYTPTPTVDPNYTPPSSTPTNTATATPVASDTPTQTATSTDVPTATNTSTPTATNTPVFVSCEYVSSGGTVIIEAENFADQASGSVTASLWIANTDYAGYSGSTAVMVPDNDVNADLTTNGPRLDFPIRLDTAGDYYIFVRGRAHSNSGGNDSVHAGIDGTAYTLSGYGLTGYTAVDNYNWRRWDTPVTIPTDGQHTFNIWMREDGMIIDQVMLSTNPNAVAEGSTAALTTSSAPAGCTGLSAPPPTSTPTNTPTNTPTPTATPTPQPNSNPSVYISVSGSGSVGGISYDDEDIIFYNGTTNTWSMYLDLSDRGLDYADVDAFTILSDGSVLLSFTDAAFNGLIQDEDFVQFVPTSTGWNTDGTFYYYFDGSDVESKYDVDAVSVLSDGRILLSTEDDETLGSTTIRHEDIAVFTPTNLGSNTSGSWDIYFDSSDTGLSQNVVGTWVTTSKIYFAVNSNISIDGLNITRSDIFACTPTDLGSSSDCTYDDTLFWDGSDYGFSGNIDALAIASP